MHPMTSDEQEPYLVERIQECESAWQGLFKILLDSTQITSSSEISGIEYIDKIIRIDQSPIGRTPRSNPATYTKAFDYIRELFAETTEAKKEAQREGVPPIELVDGDKLVEMFEKLELGLLPQKTYEINTGFFEEFSKK